MMKTITLIIIIIIINTIFVRLAIRTQTENKYMHINI